MRQLRRLFVVLLALTVISGCGFGLTGCAIAHLIGGAAQNFEYQKQVQTPPKYDSLSGQRVAVLVDADMSTQYQYSDLVPTLISGISVRLARDVPDIRLVRPEEILAWQWKTPQWSALAYGEMAESLDVDRVVFVDIYEFRLNPVGNQWIWEGVCGASVSVIERDGFEPDVFADTFNVVGSFPNVSNVTREGASAEAIKTGVMAEFIKRTAWLFHEHLEPKYPSKYRPELG